MENLYVQTNEVGRQRIRSLTWSGWHPDDIDISVFNGVTEGGIHFQECEVYNIDMEIVSINEVTQWILEDKNNRLYGEEHSGKEFIDTPGSIEGFMIKELIISKINGVVIVIGNDDVEYELCGLIGEPISSSVIGMGIARIDITEEIQSINQLTARIYTNANSIKIALKSCKKK